MKKQEHKFPYKWTLQDAKFTKDKGTVFSCFACGGGSTMGYKLAGFDVLGCNEIDPKMIAAYKANHNPKYAYCEPIQTFKDRTDLPAELYNLDILDGSPPCSSFSMAGNREKDWGKEKQFREGQSLQVLDTLFFDFIDLAKKLQPKIVIAENVKGLLMGGAKSYVREIYKQFDAAGYYLQHFLLDASKMGVPQRRERVFFIALRKDLATPFLVQKDFFTIVPKLELKFNEREIICDFLEKGGELGKANYSENRFGDIIIDKNIVFPTLTSNDRYFYDNKHFTTIKSLKLISTFPLDFNLMINENNKDTRTQGQYLLGMSAPPIMVAQIATKIYEQWISKL